MAHALLWNACFCTHFAPIHWYSLSFVPKPIYLFIEAQNTKSTTKSTKIYGRRQARCIQIHVNIMYIIHSSNTPTLELLLVLKRRSTEYAIR